MATTGFRAALPEQARLADSGLACDHQRAAVTFGQAIEGVAEFPQLLVAADHDRAQKLRHGSEHATADAEKAVPNARSRASWRGRPGAQSLLGHLVADA